MSYLDDVFSCFSVVANKSSTLSALLSLGNPIYRIFFVNTPASYCSFEVDSYGNTIFERI
jgi:hypothetical protein